MTNESNNNDFKARLDYIISKTGVDKKLFAKQCGISENQIYNYLKRDQEPGTKFYRGLKENYPNISIDWLISGDGEPFVDDQKKPTENIIGLQYNNIIQKFDDKEFALEVSQALMSVEKTSLKEFYKLGWYIKALSESGIEIHTEPGRLQYQQNDSDTWDGAERRSGKDRRKSVSEELPPVRKNDAPTG